VFRPSKDIPGWIEHIGIEEFKRLRQQAMLNPRQDPYVEPSIRKLVRPEASAVEGYEIHKAVI